MKIPASLASSRLRCCGVAVAGWLLVTADLSAMEPGLAPGKSGLDGANEALDSAEIHRFDSTELNRAELKVALERLDAEISALSARADATEPRITARLAELRARRAALVRPFPQPSFDALVTDLTTERHERNF